jgi:hypothetical protein
LNRRQLLGGVTGCLATFIPHLGAWAQQDLPGSGLRFRAIQVDARPLAERGAGSTANLIQQILPGKLRSVFADRLAAGDRNGMILVARIDRLFLSSYAENSSPGFDSMGTTDSIEGAGIVVAGGRTLSVTPLRTPLSASYSGAYNLPDIDIRRVDSFAISSPIGSAAR